MQIARAPTAGDGFVEHRAALHLLNVLAKIANSEFFGNRNVSLIGRFFAHDHSEERGLARAIRAHQSDLLAGIQLEGSIHEHELLAVLLIDIGKRNHPKFNANRCRSVSWWTCLAEPPNALESTR